MPQILSVAVCISEEVTLSDFITPMELLAGLNDADDPVWGVGMGEVPYRVEIDYVAPTMDPVVSLKGRNSPTINPTLTYADAAAHGKQFDIIWVPAGPVPSSRIPKEEIAFIKQQASKAKYMISVCGGAVQLAFAGVLSGKRATTNKAWFRVIVAETPKDIEWVTKARWVVDGNVWTSSGVTAGCDMVLAFMEHLVGPKITRHIRGAAEVREITDTDDPFAEFHGLV
ncbi:DJ-1 protein-PfpI domain-containing protein [Mycena venus]|uniref:DJ-1 protein-PfpI domain-containing protein n=1 Tax=Mycena venus TaxID=2733690 RepID=A0A8H6U0D1_9AGAR|nr:DJ-1 protein-PfpI domain-containing protein [Mycena venus]